MTRKGILLIGLFLAGLLALPSLVQTFVIGGEPVLSPYERTFQNILDNPGATAADKRWAREALAEYHSLPIDAQARVDHPTTSREAYGQSQQFWKAYCDDRPDKCQ